MLWQTVAFDGECERRRRKPAEGFLRCVAARPAGAGRKKGRRHYGRNDRWLLVAGIGWRWVESKTGREILRCVAAHPEERDAGKNGPPLRLRMTRGFMALRWFASRSDWLG